MHNTPDQHRQRAAERASLGPRVGYFLFVDGDYRPTGVAFSKLDLEYHSSIRAAALAAAEELGVIFGDLRIVKETDDEIECELWENYEDEEPALTFRVKEDS